MGPYEAATAADAANSNDTRTAEQRAFDELAEDVLGANPGEVAPPPPGLGPAYAQMLEDARAYFKGYANEITPFHDEQAVFLLCREFHVLPDQIEKQSRYWRQVLWDLMLASK